MGTKGNYKFRHHILAVALLFMGVFMAVCLSSCQKEEIDEEKEEISLEEIFSEKEESDVEEEENIEENVFLIEEEPEWVPAYREFLKNSENIRPLLMEMGEGGLTGFITGFYLYDVNYDEIPELFLQKDRNADYIYTFNGGEIELRNVIGYNAFGEAFFGYDERDGQVYSFQLGEGTGTDRGTGIAKMSLREEAYDMGKTIGAFPIEDTGLEWIYSALYGGIEQMDGTYINLEWEDAITSEDSVITKGEFMGITKHFVPFVFQEISEETIDSYVNVNYKSFVSKQSLEEYEKFMEEKQKAFWKEAPVFEVRNGEMVLPDTVTVMEDEVGTIYCDIGRLSCYPERSVDLSFQQEWKHTYWGWMKNIESEVDEYGESVVASEIDAKFWFENWEGVEYPILCIDSGSAVSRINCYMIYDDKVCNFACFGKAAMGRTSISLISGGEYYFKYISTSSPNGASYEGMLYRVNQGKKEQIWRIWWEEVDEAMFEGIELSDQEIESINSLPTFDVPDCMFEDREISKEESIIMVDDLLGEGAALQLIDYLSADGISSNIKLDGPLVMKEFSYQTIYDLSSLTETFIGLPD